MHNDFSLPAMVGRTREMEIMERALRAVQDSQGRCILLTGEAGIGKSRLAAELCNHAAVSRFTIIRGYCFEQDTSFLFAPWIDALRTFLAPKDQAEASALLDVFAAELVKILPELSLLLPSMHPSPLLDPEAEKHRLFESLARFFASLATNHPVVILLEDLHWSDQQSLELLYFLIRRIAELPILVLGTYRSEGILPQLVDYLTRLKRERLVEEIRLSPLDRPEVGEMVQAILNMEDPPRDEWLDLLMPLTEGYPFYVEEITKSLVQTGTQPGQWDPRRLPISIQHDVEMRVETLHEKTRRVLSLAAVIGERFDFALLQEITAEDEPALVQKLKELIEARLIVEQSADQFAFRHALTHEVVYGGMMLRERKALHQMIGETIERFAPLQADASVSPLAYHFYHAENWQKAMAYSQRAGERALTLYAPGEALTHFSHALEAAGKLGIPVPLACLRGRGQARSIIGDLDGARADYESIIELARRTSDRYNEWQALMDLGYAWQLHDLGRAGEYFQQSLRMARSMDNRTVLGLTLIRTGNWYFFRSLPDKALALHREALEIFQNIGDLRGMAESLQHLGMASYGIGAVIQGRAYYEQAIPLLRQVDDRQALVRALEFLCMQARLDTEVLGEIVFSQLARYGEQAYEIAHNFDWREGEGEALSRTAICWIRVGEYARGYELLQRAQTLGEEIEHHHLLTSIHLLRGEWYLDLLDLEQARHHLELAFTLAQQVGALQLLKSAAPLLVNTCILQNDLSRAKTVVEVLSLPKEISKIERAGAFERLCWSAQAELELALKQPAHGLEIVDHLIGSAQNIANYGPHAIPWLSQLRARALVKMRRFEEAAAELTGAQLIAQSRHERPLLWRLQADLGIVYRQLGQREDAAHEFSSARTIILELANHVPDETLRTNFLQRALATIPTQHTLTSRQMTKKEYSGLTAREREVAILIARGKSNREIADELVISEKTAERHVSNILSKLSFNARTQIAAWAVGKGLVE